MEALNCRCLTGRLVNQCTSQRGGSHQHSLWVHGESRPYSVEQGVCIISRRRAMSIASGQRDVLEALSASAMSAEGIDTCIPLLQGCETLTGC